MRWRARCVGLRLQSSYYVLCSHFPVTGFLLFHVSHLDSFAWHTHCDYFTQLVHPWKPTQVLAAWQASRRLTKLSSKCSHKYSVLAGAL